ncbi:MAG: serine/threonine protein kinase [Lachnospiraceae bacterium]|nr:serine/threonine protein kinase [Lachnospiraceae bacterium]
MLNDILKKGLSEYNDWNLLGRGTFSTVYRVRERNTGRWLACKVVVSRELAEREKEFLQKASHPLFPRFDRFVELQDQWCIVMEYIPGITLKEWIVRRGALGGRQAAWLGSRLAEGLLSLHEQPVPVIYRDLKPENVMIQQDGRVRLIDLGCACYVEEMGKTQAGTRGYAAPEQLKGDGTAGVESDVYALGKLLQFAAGVDIGGERRGSCRSKSINRKNKCKLPRAFICLLEDMTRQERKQRVPDMRIFLQRIEQFTGTGKKRGVTRWYTAFRKWGTGQRHRKGNMEFYYQKNINKGT